jgi:hypothetical protein
MEEWQNEIAAAWKDLTVLAEAVGRELTEIVEEVTTEAQELLNLHWEELKDVLTELWPEIELEFEEPTPVNWDIYPYTQPMPDPSTHAACVGCLNYNGTAYGGNLLVCGIHPYGCESAACPDWEGENHLN